MALINENFIKIPETYLFSEISKRVSVYRSENPDADIIRMAVIFVEFHGNDTFKLVPIGFCRRMTVRDNNNVRRK